MKSTLEEGDKPNQMKMKCSGSTRRPTKEMGIFHMWMNNHHSVFIPNKFVSDQKKNKIRLKSGKKDPHIYYPI